MGQPDIIPIHTSGLIALAEAKRWLAQARDILLVQDLRDKASAIKHYLRQRDDSDSAARDAAELCLRAERRLGELLAETVDHGGGRRASLNNTVLPEEISPMQSSRYQQAARVPEAVFEAHVEKAREANDLRGLTSAAVRRLASMTKDQELEVRRLPGACRIETARMEDFLPTLTNVDLILTDPPYPEEYLPLYGELARLAARVLAPHGVLAVMCGHYHLPRVFALMTPHLRYRWTMAYLTPGGQAAQIWPVKVNTFWKPVLLFGAAPRWLGDVVRSDVNDNDKRFHDWGQSESGMLALVEALSQPGELVVDPFLGGGTTALAALALGRRFAGCDSDPECIAKLEVPGGT